MLYISKLYFFNPVSLIWRDFDVINLNRFRNFAPNYGTKYFGVSDGVGK